MVLALSRSRRPTLGVGRLVRLDGPAGSGKTTLAAAVAALAVEDGHSCRVVHMDDLYDGWDGLPRVGEQLDGLLESLARGDAGHYQHYDWQAGRFTETVEVHPVDLLVLEGVGSGAAAHDVLGTVLVWVEAPHELRQRRGIERDGSAFATEWERWARDERRLFEREHTRQRADLIVDGTGGSAPLSAAAR